MNLDRRMAVGNGLILTLLGRAVSEHETQMNSVHFFQGDCHLGDSSCYYLTSSHRIHTTLPFHLTPVFVCFLLVLFFLFLIVAKAVTTTRRQPLIRKMSKRVQVDRHQTTCDWIENALENIHLVVSTHLNRLHPARLFDLVVDDRSVLTDCFIPCSKTDGVL